MSKPELKVVDKPASATEIVNEMKRQVKELIKLGTPAEQIINQAIYSYGTALGGEEVKANVIEIIDNYGDYNLIQLVMRSKIIQEINGRDNYLLDPRSRQVIKISKERLKEILSPKLDISDKTYTCRFDYNPYAMKQLYQNEHGDWFYNLYQPPAWQEDCFYSQGKVEVPKRDEIPTIYKDFLFHLVNSDQRSYDYVIDWLANGLQARNFCILTTIGDQGIGKGTLGRILKDLFGKDNFGETGKRILNGQFNSQVKYKRLIYCDEATVRNEDQEERLKVLVNQAIEVEAKGKDAEQITNYASVYFSSNSLDAIRLDAKDRRFSIVELTSEQLPDKYSIEEMDALVDIENIKQLAYYLYYKPVDRRAMTKVFKTERTELVRSSALGPWQDWILDVYSVEKAGKTIPVLAVSEAIVDKFGGRHYSTAIFRKLAAMYPKKLEVYKPVIDGKQVWAIRFPEKKN